MGSISILFTNQAVKSQDSNPVLLGGKQECFLYATPPPPRIILKSCYLFLPTVDFYVWCWSILVYDVNFDPIFYQATSRAASECCGRRRRRVPPSSTGTCASWWTRTSSSTTPTSFLRRPWTTCGTGENLSLANHWVEVNVSRTLARRSTFGTNGSSFADNVNYSSWIRICFTVFHSRWNFKHHHRTQRAVMLCFSSSALALRHAKNAERELKYPLNFSSLWHWSLEWLKLSVPSC